MSKLLVNAPSGAQEIIEVGDGGGYFDAARVLWDERDDGPLPAITLGGMVRKGAGLVFDQARMDEHIAAIAPPTPVPASCTRRQGLLALLAYGHRRADIEALIVAIPDEMEREAALIEYEAATWERANPFLQQMWAQLGGTPEQLDDLFRMAAAL